MNVIGFSFHKILIDKIQKESLTKSTVSTNIKFTDLIKDKTDLLKDAEIVKLHFQHTIDYENPENKKEGNQAALLFEGIVHLSVTKDESKDIQKAWKKGELPNETKLPLYNVIMKKCNPWAIHLEDAVELPFHVPMPRLTQQKK